MKSGVKCFPHLHGYYFTCHYQPHDTPTGNGHGCKWGSEEERVLSGLLASAAVGFQSFPPRPHTWQPMSIQLVFIVSGRRGSSCVSSSQPALGRLSDHQQAPSTTCCLLTAAAVVLISLDVFRLEFFFFPPKSVQFLYPTRRAKMFVLL